MTINDDKFTIYRNTLLDDALTVLSLASGVNLIFTIHQASQIGWRPHATLQALAVTLFIIMRLVRNSLSYNIKVFGILSCAYTIIFATLVNIGPMANSKAGVIVMLLIAAIFLDPFYIAVVYAVIILGFVIASYLAINNFTSYQFIDYQIQSHDPDTWINMSMVLIAGGSVVAWLARSMIGELIASRKAAEVANQTKSQFLANISHELRTPLNSILGFTSLLLEQQHLTPAQREQLAIIAHSGNSLHRLIDDVLDLVRAEAGRFKLQMQPVFFLKLINEIVDITRLRIEAKGLILRVELAKSFPQQLFLDGERLRQVILNLLDNATKFTEYGEICLAINFNLVNSSCINLLISITDTGPGISPIDQERIFLPFEQVYNQEHRGVYGLGLGLAVCQQLAKLMDGQLTLRSTVGQGSSFTLQLPLVNIVTPIADFKRPTQLFGYQFHANHIVIADDVAANRTLLRTWLIDMGLTCTETSDGIAAIAYTTYIHPALVLLDIKMPKLDGFQVAQRLKADPTTANIPLIAVTAVFSELIKNQDNQKLFAAWLTKPFKHDDLATCLAKFLPHEKFVIEPPITPATNTIVASDLPLDTDLIMLGELVELKMISEIQDWIHANLDSYPQFTQRLHELVRACDLRLTSVFLDECRRVRSD